jgi:hypothetical protein
MDTLIELGRLLLLLALTTGPLAGLALLLNRRNQKAERLLGLMAAQLGSPALRGRVGLEVRVGLLRPRATVVLHLLAASGSEVVATLGRLAKSLPSEVRLVADGSVNGGRDAFFTAETRGVRRPEPVVGRAAA